MLLVSDDKRSKITQQGGGAIEKIYYNVRANTDFANRKHKYFHNDDMGTTLNMG